MKVSELRVGNWVIDGRFEYQLCLSDFYNMYLDEDCPFKPITLTEEWLLKFGFKRSLSNYYWININDHRIEIKQVKGGFVLLDDNGSWASFVFNSLHQLQNLYHALTGKEL